MAYFYRVWLLLLGCFFLISSAQAQTATSRATQLNAESSEAVLKSHLKTSDPYRVDCLVLLGLKAVKNNDLKSGENYFKQALAINVQNERTLTNRVFALCSLGIVNMMNVDYTNGKVRLAEAIKLSNGLPVRYKPVISELMAGYSMAVYETGYYDEAEKIIKQARVLKPNCEVCGEVEERLVKADKRPDYFSDLDKERIRWNDDTKVLKIFVQEPDDRSNWNADYGPAVQESFAKWETAIEHKITFEFVDDPVKADVRLLWIHQGPKGGVIETGENFIDFHEQYLAHNDIHVYLYTEEGKAISRDEVYTTLLHEIGHMLGLQGHSKNDSDVMSESGLGRIITKRDITTFNRLYELPPDFTNKTGLTLGEYRQQLGVK